MRLLSFLILFCCLLVSPSTKGALKGEYWNVSSSTTVIPNREADLIRIDDNIDFLWRWGSPNYLINNNYFVVRWTGKLLAPNSGDYYFRTKTNDGVKLWINGVLLINNWNSSRKTNDSSSIYLEGNRNYDIRMEFNERRNKARAELYWKSSRDDYTIIAPKYFDASPVSTICTANFPPLLFSDNFSRLKSGWQARNFNRSVSAWPNDSIYNSNGQEQSVVFNVVNGEMHINGSISDWYSNEFGMVAYPLASDEVIPTLISNFVISSSISPDPTNYNNDVGIVFGFIDDRNYFIARWTRYGLNYRYNANFPGNYRQLELIKVSAGAATRLDSVDGFYENSWFNLKVVVNNNDITVCVDDQVKLFAPKQAPMLNEFGIFTYDNDDGVYIDDVDVWADVVKPVAATLTSEWQFDELIWSGVTGEVIDNIGSNDGIAKNGGQTVNSSPVFNGNPGTCRYGQFDGAGAHVTLQNTLGNSFSITGWIRPTSDFVSGNLPYLGQPVFWSDSATLKNDFIVAGLNIAGENRLSFMTGSDSGDKILIGKQPIEINQWTHITITRDGQTGVIAIYVNGQFDSALNTDNTNRLNDNQKVLVAGNTIDSKYFSGDIDEVRFYDGVLLGSQIETIITQTHPCIIPLDPVLDMRFDELSWDNDNDVIDSSDGGHHGTAFDTNSIASPFCRAADFSKNSISDYISIDHQAMAGLNDFTVIFWGKTNSTGDMPALSLANKTSSNEAVLYFDGGYSSHRFWPTIDQSLFDTNTRLNVNLNLADNQWHQYVWSRSGASKQSCFWLDGQAQGCVTHNNTGPLTVALNGLIIGQDQDRVAGGFDKRQNWRGLMDELLVFERVLIDTEINQIKDNIEGGLTWQGQPRNCGDSVDHYRLEYQSSGLTCQASNVAVKACANANCDILVNQNITGVLSPAAYWLGGEAITFNGETNAQLAITSPQSTALNFNSTSHPAPVRCFRDNQEVTDCSLEFKDSGFIFSNIPTQISSKPSNLEYNHQILTLKAVTKNTGTGSCRAVFPDNSTVNIELNYQCNGDCSTSSVKLSNNNNTHLLTRSFDSYPVTFGLDSTAQFSLLYPDAAALSINVRKEVVFGTNVSALIEGSSNPFVVKPFGFKLSLADGIYFADDVDDPVYKPAGKTFKVNISPIGWLKDQDLEQGNFDGKANQGVDVKGNPTVGYFANYQNESVSLDRGLMFPQEGSSGNFISQGGNFTGVNAQVTASWSEVGIISLKASSNDINGYLGTDSIEGYLSNVGRFVPDHFNVTAING
ncbi:MAG: hypothetical protein HRU22_03100, partial [Gammaproteobacteria bacterium]|nr:hypothetical protein [Gammaproteobacteria bacterium]